MNADPLIVHTTARMLSELCGPEVVTAAEDGIRPDALWDALEASALTRAWVPEALGGPGTTLADGFAIARLAGTHAVPAPLAETLLAGWLAAEAGLELRAALPPSRPWMAPLPSGSKAIPSPARRRASHMRVLASTSSSCSGAAAPVA